MEAILDGGFMLACMRKRIDFIKELQQQGYTVKIPKEVVHQLKDLKKSSRASRQDRVMVDSLLAIINTKQVKNVSFGAQKLNDALIERGRAGAHIGTSSNAVRHSLPTTLQILENQGTLKLM